MNACGTGGGEGTMEQGPSPRRGEPFRRSFPTLEPSRGRRTIMRARPAPGARCALAHRPLPARRPILAQTLQVGRPAARRACAMSPISQDLRQLVADRAFPQIKSHLQGLSTRDAADLLEELPPTSRAVVFRLLEKDRAIEVFEYLEGDKQQEL